MVIFKRFFHMVAIFACAAFVAGCGTASKPFASRSLKADQGRKMALLSFDNLSKTQGAGKSMENMILTEFLKSSPVTIVDPGEVAAALSEERVRLATSIPRETIMNLGKKLGVDLFMVGIVHEYEMQMASGTGGSGQIPVIAITLRIVDAASGDIVWAINASRTGNDKETVFGIGKIQSLNTLADDTAKQIARSFADSLKK